MYVVLRKGLELSGAKWEEVGKSVRMCISEQFQSMIHAIIIIGRERKNRPPYFWGIYETIGKVYSATMNQSTYRPTLAVPTAIERWMHTQSQSTFIGDMLRILMNKGGLTEAQLAEVQKQFNRGN